MSKIHSALDDYSTGICIKTEFNADVYEDVYRGHVAALTNIQRTNPDGYHRLMADIYNMTLYVVYPIILQVSEWILTSTQDLEVHNVAV